MSLEVAVGVPLEDDEDFAEWRKSQFEEINRALAEAGIVPHHEPDEVPDERQYEAQVGSYGMLHKLRRIAAFLEAGLGMPEPSDESAADDPVLRERFVDFAPASRFAHLLEHSDAEGFYVPIDFPNVIIDDEICGSALGSSFSLRRECEDLAKVLALPLDLDPDEAFDGGDGSARWHAYPAEARVCLVLHRAAVASIESGAALVFC